MTNIRVSIIALLLGSLTISYASDNSCSVKKNIIHSSYYGELNKEIFDFQYKKLNNFLRSASDRDLDSMHQYIYFRNAHRLLEYETTCNNQCCKTTCDKKKLSLVLAYGALTAFATMCKAPKLEKIFSEYNITFNDLISNEFADLTYCGYDASNSSLIPHDELIVEKANGYYLKESQ